MKNLILTIPMILTFCLMVSVQTASGQAKAPIIWTQGAMTAQAKLKWTLTKKKYVDFTFDFANGKPGFNIVGGKNLNKIKYVMFKPDGSVLAESKSPNSDSGKYVMRVSLKSPYSNSLSPVTFWLDIWME